MSTFCSKLQHFELLRAGVDCASILLPIREQMKRKIEVRSFATGVSMEEDSGEHREDRNLIALSAERDDCVPVEHVSTIPTISLMSNSGGKAPNVLGAVTSLNSDDIRASAGEESSNFAASVRVDVPLLRFITGKGGKTKEIIEKETNTKLCVPLPHEVNSGSCVVVEGLSQEAVDAAVTRIQNVLQEAVTSPSLQYSHFISLPLAVHSAIFEQVTKFQDSVLASLHTASEVETSELASSCAETVDRNSVLVGEVDIADGGRLERTFTDHVGPDKEALITKGVTKGDEEATEELINDDAELEKVGMPIEDVREGPSLSKNGWGIDKSIFVKPTTFHVTVLMLKLWNQERVAAAAEVLQGVRSKVVEALEGRPIAVRLRGMECMRGSPAKAHVLYKRVEEVGQENRLARACQVIIDEFSEADLVLEKDRNQQLKLHATLMNTSHRKNTQPGKRGKWFNKRIPFDARQILVKHGSEDWGEHAIVEAHLSQRFVYGENGYYHCCGSIEFPSADPSANIVKAMALES